MLSGAKALRREHNDLIQIQHDLDIAEDVIGRLANYTSAALFKRRRVVSLPPSLPPSPELVIDEAEEEADDELPVNSVERGRSDRWLNDSPVDEDYLF